jgi:hypothetical protein
MHHTIDYGGNCKDSTDDANNFYKQNMPLLVLCVSENGDGIGFISKNMEKLLLEVDHWKWCDYYFVGSNSVVVKII